MYIKKQSLLILQIGLEYNLTLSFTVIFFYVIVACILLYYHFLSYIELNYSVEKQNAIIWTAVVEGRDILHVIRQEITSKGLTIPVHLPFITDYSFLVDIEVWTEQTTDSLQ